MHASKKRLALLLVLPAVVAGCAQTIPKEALQLTEERLAQRQVQTRRFETSDEKVLLGATATLLQDLGFTLDESETELGVIVASKDRDAREVGQYVRAFLLAAVGVYTRVDQRQKMRVSVVTRPVGEKGENMAVRVTFQRIVWNESNMISKMEPLNEPKAYQEFFEMLSKAVFLDAHEI